jgi:hypothetical protein
MAPTYNWGTFISLDEMKAMRWVRGGDNSIVGERKGLRLRKSHDTYGAKVTCSFTTCMCQSRLRNITFQKEKNAILACIWFFTNKISLMA